jgi:hypothetical protein
VVGGGGGVLRAAVGGVCVLLLVPRAQPQIYSGTR